MLTFEPGAINAGAHRFAIGGTHNPRAPTFECLARAYLPLIGRMGPRIAIELERAGFEPAGGGVVHVRIEPVPWLDPLHLETRGTLLRVAAEVLLSKLPAHIAEREAAALASELDIEAESVRVRSIDDSPGPGNVVTVLLESEQITDVFAEFGRRGIPAERVAQHAAFAAKRYLASDVPIGVHLADQLLLPLALAGSGSFVTLPPSAHTRTNIDVIQAFLPVAIRCAALDETGRWKIEVTQRTD